jgi:predicted nicotinamide N-methyase
MTAVTENEVPGGWSDRSITVGPHQFQLSTPADPDALLDKLESPEAATIAHFADPYWAKLWPAAPLLAAAIVRNPRPRGMDVLELGCGSGLVGITALACGLDVTFSDYVPLAVNLALENAARNGFKHARGVVLDWRFPPDVGRQQFPLVFASDVTYDHANLAPLLNILDCFLASGGQAWFGDAGRSPLPDFLRMASDRGWHISLFDQHDRASPAPTLGQYRRVVLRRKENATL